MINNYGIRKDNISFSGVYSLKGTSKEIAQAYEIIVAKNAKNEVLTDFLDISANEDCRIVFTDDDIWQKRNTRNLMYQIKYNFIILAKDLLDPLRLKFFNPVKGACEKRISIDINDMKVKCIQKNDNKRIKKVYSIVFNKNMTVPEGFLELIKFLQRFVQGIKFDLYTPIPLEELLNIYKYAVDSSKTLRHLKMKAYTGSGVDNMAIETTDNRILKLSIEPNYPVQPEFFELPILDKGIINIRNLKRQCEKVYYYIQPKGINSDETVITEEMVDLMKNVMRKAGFEPYDMHTGQLVIHNGQVFLADTGCIKGRELVE
jgi:hypothetical protein